MSHGQFSSICDGASTKSCGTLVPEKREYFACVRIVCIAWPNSWKIVSTSSCDMSDGLSGWGGGKLQTSAQTGRWYFPSGKSFPSMMPNCAK